MRVGRSYTCDLSMATLYETRTDRTLPTENNDTEVTELAYVSRTHPMRFSAVLLRIKVKFVGASAPSVRSLGWVRVTDVAKRRRQELVACRAALPFEGL